jgi:hypothetical protein
LGLLPGANVSPARCSRKTAFSRLRPIRPREARRGRPGPAPPERPTPAAGGRCGGADQLVARSPGSGRAIPPPARAGRRRDRRAGQGDVAVVGQAPGSRAGASIARSTSSAPSQIAAPWRIRSLVPLALGSSGEPGTASTSRPCSAARRAVISEPERNSASTTTTALRQAGDDPVAAREVAGHGGAAGFVLGDHAAGLDDLVVEAGVLRRIDVVHPAAQHRHGAGGQGALDAPPHRCRAPGRRPPSRPALAELGGEAAGEPLTGGRGHARADDRHGGPVRVGPPAARTIDQRRRRVECAERLRERLRLRRRRSAGRRGRPRLSASSVLDLGRRSGPGQGPHAPAAAGRWSGRAARRPGSPSPNRCDQAGRMSTGTDVLGARQPQPGAALGIRQRSGSLRDARREPPILGSSPFSRRRMFSRVTDEDQHGHEKRQQRDRRRAGRTGSGVDHRQRRRGRGRPAPRCGTGSAVTRIQVAPAATPTGQAAASRVPKKVATPLPPLKLQPDREQVAQEGRCRPPRRSARACVWSDW